MSPCTVRVSPQTTIGKAIDELVKADVGLLLVVDANGQLIGTLGEATMLAAALDSQLRHDPVSLHMTRRFVGIDPSAPLETVLDQMILHNVSTVPVVDRGRPLGTVTSRDVLRNVFGRRVEVA
jgi:CBS domain-containing protein